MTTVLVRPWGALESTSTKLLAHSAWGSFEVPSQVYARSMRLDRKYPNNYRDGYLEAWCRRQSEKK